MKKPGKRVNFHTTFEINTTERVIAFDVGYNQCWDEREKWLKEMCKNCKERDD